MTKSRHLGDLAQLIPSSIGSAAQTLQVNSGATALEYADASGGGVTVYNNYSDLPSSGNTDGDMGWVKDVTGSGATKALYVWDGAEWDRVYSDVQEGPVFSTNPNSAYNFLGSNITVNVAATDPDGFPVTYSVVTNPANQAQATVTQSSGTFTFAPSSNSSNGGSFTAKFVADDGIYKTISSVLSTFTLSFDPLNGSVMKFNFTDAGSGSGALDNSGTTGTASLSTSNTGYSWTSSGKIGTAFDQGSIGSGNAANSNLNPCIILGGLTDRTTYSIGAWVKYTHTGTGFRYIFSSSSASFSVEYQYLQWNAYSNYYKFFDGSSTITVNSSDGIPLATHPVNDQSRMLTPNDWHHVVLTASPTNKTKFYYNGSLKKTGTNSPKTLGAGNVIGNYYSTRNSTSNAQYNFRGTIDQFFVTYDELTASEVTTVYNTTTAWT